MLRSTFLGYKTATSALKLNQNAMDVVGQNMSNINTKGYTRQRLDINSVSFNTSNLKFGTSGVMIGQGVDASGVSQYRDSFLDMKYRIEAAKTGNADVELEALSDLESIFDEMSVDGLDAQFSKLLQQLNSLTSSPSDPVLEGVVRTSAQMLTQMFNDYSQKIDTVRNQQYEYLKNGAEVKVNQLMESIADLNKQIKDNNISGNSALELNDERNMLIDELSNYVDIDVDVEAINIGGDKTVDELSINLKLSDNSKVKIVDNDKYSKLKVSVPDGQKDVKVELEKSIETPDTGKDLTDLIRGGQIGGYINFLNGKGELAVSTDVDSKTKGVQYYNTMLDSLANKFATIMNDHNKSPETYDANGIAEARTFKPLFGAKGIDKDDVNVNEKITAGNIKIHDNWTNATGSYITNTLVKPKGDIKGATDNILKMINAFKSNETFTANSTDLFKGTFQEFLSYTTTSLNLQVADAQNSYDMYSVSQFQIDYARSSLSSVDLNEEGVNLLQYSKSYNAAARLMTTLDEMLDNLINRMGA